MNGPTIQIHKFTCICRLTSVSTTIVITSPKLPNLTEECVGKYGMCWYHESHLPNTCHSTTCRSVNMVLQGLWEVVYSEETKSIQVPEHTRCQYGKW